MATYNQKEMKRTIRSVNGPNMEMCEWELDKDTNGMEILKQSKRGKGKRKRKRKEKKEKEK